MDKKLLDALSNLSVALEEIADALKSKEEPTSSVSKGIKGGNFIKEIQEISVGVKALREDTKKILSNQETIIKMGSMSKSDSKTKEAQKLGGDPVAKKNFKEGIASIMLIAVAVLAIGAAFKIIGNVDFVSVIALSAALVLLSYAFEKVYTTLKKSKFDPKKDSINFVIAITSIAIAVTISSWILSTIIPISFSKFLSAALIAGMFAVLALSVYDFISAFKKTTWSQVVKSVVMFPLILPAIALGIAASSWALSLIKPIGFDQAITAILIAGVFAVVSLGIGKFIGAFKDMKKNEIISAAIFLPLILPALGLSIALSSLFFSWVTPIRYDQFLTIVVIAAAFTIISFGLKQLVSAFSGLKPAEAILAATLMPIVLIAISLSITASSYILSKTKDVSWGVLLKVIAIGAVLAALGIIFYPAIRFLGKLQIAELAKGLVAVVLIAGAIMVSSHIFSVGNYGKYPNLNWAKGVGLSLLAFVPAVLVLGLVAATGVGALVIAAGVIAIQAIAGSIVAASEVLSKGKYTGGPTKEWASGVGSAIIAFSPVLNAMLKSGLLSKRVKPEEMKSAIVSISEGIVEAANFFNKNQVAFEGGPTKEWTERVGGAISSFSSVFEFMSNRKIKSVNKVTDVIIGVSQAIVRSAAIFSVNRKFFDVNIDPNFGSNISKVISDYSSILESLSGDKKLKGGLFNNPINTIVSGMFRVASGYDRLAKALNNFSNSLDKLDSDKINSFTMMTGNIAMLSALDSNMFSNMMRVLESRSDVFTKMLESQANAIRPSVIVGSTRDKQPSGDVKVKSGSAPSPKVDSQLKTLKSAVAVLTKIDKKLESIDDFLQNKANENKDI